MTLSLKESKWRLRQQQTFQTFFNGGKVTVEQILGSEEMNKSKRAGL